MSAPLPEREHEHEHEHEFEAALGLPELLPKGEKILWQGSPHWRALAVHTLHVRALSFYFSVMLLWRASTLKYDGASWFAVAQSMALLLPLALIALGLLTGFAWLTSKTSVYTVTNRRVVMRIGIVLTVTFNLPHRLIESVSLRPLANETADIALLLAPTDNIAYGNLWPHARPWRLRRTEPMLRAVPDGLKVGELLASAMRASVSSSEALVGTGVRPSQVQPAYSEVRQTSALTA